MTFIPESMILDSISFAIQDLILTIGGMFNNFTELNPDILQHLSSDKYLLNKNPVIFDPSNDTSDYYDNLMRKLSRINPNKNFDPNNLLPIQLLSPNNNSNSSINYINRIITKGGVVSSPVKASYSYKIVKVLTSWPENPEEIVLPTIAINSGQFDGTGWEIGSDLHNNKYLYYIEVWAGNNTQRSWLCSILERALRIDLPLIDFEMGYPILSDGTINNSFDLEAQRIRWLKIEKCRFTFLPNLSNTVTSEKARASGTLSVSLIV